VSNNPIPIPIPIPNIGRTGDLANDSGNDRTTSSPPTASSLAFLTVLLVGRADTPAKVFECVVRAAIPCSRCEKGLLRIRIPVSTKSAMHYNSERSPAYTAGLADADDSFLIAEAPPGWVCPKLLPACLATVCPPLNLLEALDLHTGDEPVRPGRFPSHTL